MGGRAIGVVRNVIVSDSSGKKMNCICQVTNSIRFFEGVKEILIILR